MKNNRMAPRQVAEIGIQALFAKKLSVVTGNWNALLAFSNRLASKRTAASIHKMMMKQSAGD